MVHTLKIATKYTRDIAKSKNIKEYNVTIDAESPKFELKIIDL